MGKIWKIWILYIRWIVFLISLQNSIYAQDIRFSSLDSYITNAMKDWRVPGLAIAVVKDNSIVYAKGYGYCGLDQKSLVDERTVFAIGSCTKSFTAAALAMLVTEGKLNWDDCVTDYLPSFQLFDPYVTREVTIRDLLTHRCGIPHTDHLWFGSTFNREEIIRRLRYVEPVWSFRTTFEYNNIMYLVAGHIVQSLTGMSWDDFMRQRLFKVLGMTESSVTISALVDKENVAIPYLDINGESVEVPWRNMDNGAPFGGINSNVIDMAQWLRFQLNYGHYEGRRLIDSSQVKVMHSPQIFIPVNSRHSSLFPKGSQFPSYGLGWFIFSYYGHKVVEHAGGIDGMMANMTMIPEKRVGIVILSNMIPQFLPISITRWVMDRVLDLPEKDWSAEGLTTYRQITDQHHKTKEEKEAARDVDSHPSLALEDYAGKYTNPIYGEAIVIYQSGKLVFNLSPSFTSTLQHCHYDTFKAVWRDTMMDEDFITFILNGDGQAAKISVERFGEFEAVSK